MYTSTFEPPWWWCEYTDQMRRARQTWGDIELPEPPRVFRPRTATEVPLLHVPREFGELWRAVEPPSGYAKEASHVRSDPRLLRLAPNVYDYTRPVWLAFDPEYGRGKPVEELWGDPELAGQEVLSGLLQFPKWSLTWFKRGAAPNLSGIQLKRKGRWTDVLYIHRSEQMGNLKVYAGSAREVYGPYASPRVRVIY